MIKTEKILRIKRQHGHTLQVVREHYLREDVPCCSELCLTNCESDNKGNTQALLPKDLTHYVVPDCPTLLHYLEIFEFPDIKGILIMQTALNAIQHEGGRRPYRRLQNLIKDIKKCSILFHNEFQKYSYCPREPGETQYDWWSRSVYQGAVWYHNHLAGQIPVVMVTSDDKIVEHYGTKTLGVFVISIKQYLENFWANLKEAYVLCESLQSSLETTTSKDTDFSTYLPQEILETGIKSASYVQGCIQVSKHNAGVEAFVRRKGSTTKDTDGQQDILIHGSVHRNRAVHGDAVVIEMLPRQQWRGRSNCIYENKENTEKGNATNDSDDIDNSKDIVPTGKVVGVLQRNWRDYVVSLSQEEKTGQQKKSGKVLVIPWDWRIPKIRISTRQVETLKSQRFIVRIDNWETGSQYPNGHFVRNLGPIGNLETEIAALLIENDIDVGSFTDALLKEMPVNSPEHPWVMNPQEVVKRKDIRESHLVFSIDPKGCEDVDDTLSVRKLENGHLELGVHIADVTYFVKPNMLADLEARSRSTTVYLADRRYDMLPAVLSSDLCSLISGVDRYAVSVFWELDKNFEVQDVWYGRTVIRSKYKLFYEIAQEIADGASNGTIISNVPELQDITDKDEQDKAIEHLRWATKMLMETARQLKSKRTQHGALELEGVEVKVQMTSDSTDKSIEDLIPKQSLEIHETIAECMIFANHWVAKKICQSYPNQALLRRHPLPREEHFANLIQCAKAKGFEVKTSSNKDLAHSLDMCEDPIDANVNKILRTLATQAMSNAAYFSTGSLARDQFFHYGLALDFYTHFTSPIRRYADVVVHRLLLAALDMENENILFKNTDLEALCENINKKHRSSQNAQRDSQELFQTLFFKDKSPDDECCIVDGVIFQLRNNGILVFLPRYGIKGPVYLKSKDGQVVYVPKDSPAEWVGGTLALQDYTLVVNSTYGAQTYRLFDHVTVRITIQEMHAHPSSLKLSLLSNKGLITDTALPEVKQQKGAMIKEVQGIADERIKSQEGVDLGEHFQKWKDVYGQSKKEKSFYYLLQSFHEMAMLDL